MFFFATLISFVLRQIVHNILFKVPTFSKKKNEKGTIAETAKTEANNRNGNSAFYFNFSVQFVC